GHDKELRWGQHLGDNDRRERILVSSIETREIFVRQTIRDIMARYVQGVDHLDVAMLKGCYHEDAFELHHIFDGNAHDFAEWRVRQTFRSHHVLSESAILIDGSRAYAETPHAAIVHVDIDEAGHRGVIEIATHGWYLDLFSERDGNWKIDFQRVVTFHSAMRLIEAPSPPAQGATTSGDPFALRFALDSERPEPRHLQDVAASIRAGFIGTNAASSGTIG
ncbi:MAG: nuclear transport factor 2 family protein, partial [Betaproteobacteria bacterium]|nr:nuclear transport factor 2 family protein [Betaproteobacteria bacterium]